MDSQYDGGLRRDGATSGFDQAAASVRRARDSKQRQRLDQRQGRDVSHVGSLTQAVALPSESVIRCAAPSLGSRWWLDLAQWLHLVRADQELRGFQDHLGESARIRQSPLATHCSFLETKTRLCFIAS